ncbi:MAG TPA: succinate dehydrogenase, cytochrome b556 subunit [Burkholderiales bacterium]|nr:succinate dehydrogenase, cytochrome b556 subunit [Burkholderiales bacterium]
MSKKRPKYLDLLKIRLPLPGWVSILHRISGVALFLFIPFLLWLLQLSVVSPESFAGFKSSLANPLVKLILFGLLWAFLHHFLAGIRYLTLDVHWGTELSQARATSVAVLVVSIVLTLLIGTRLW